MISGFKSTGVFPVHKTKYKLSHLDKIELELYTAWKTKKSPLDLDGSPILDFAENTPKATEWSSDMPNDPQPSTSAPSLSVGDSADQKCTDLSMKQLIKLLQNKASDGIKYEMYLVPKDENVTLRVSSSLEVSLLLLTMSHQRSENKLKWMEVYFDK